MLINGMYEVQILDSYDNPTYPDGQAGALYGQTPPLGQRLPKPPGEWQTYDIIFESPRWDAKPALVKEGGGDRDPKRRGRAKSPGIFRLHRRHQRDSAQIPGRLSRNRILPRS
jgi:hypothetical protein